MYRGGPRSARLVAERFEPMEERYGDRPAGLAGVSGDLGGLGEDGLGPHGVSSIPDQLLRTGPELVVADLHLGNRGGTEVLEPVRVPW